MRICELQANSKVINLVATIDSLGEEQTNPQGTKLKEGIISDDSGQVKLTLWREQIDRFSVGDKIIISSGWCKEFQGEFQVSTGMHGKINLVPKDNQQ